MNEVKSPTDRLVNRTALIMVLSACCFIFAGMAIPFAFGGTGAALAAQLAIAALSTVGLGLAALVVQMRNKLERRGDVKRPAERAKEPVRRPSRPSP